MNLEQLKQKLPFKWRAQSCNQYGAIMVPYIDARDQMDLLDKVCGQENWSDEYLEIGTRLICKLSIRIEKDLWISKQDSGTTTKIEGEKGGISDAFKRAGVKWGINRQAYEQEPIKLKAKEYKSKWYPISDDGKFLKGQNLNNYCNEKAGI